MIYKDNIIPAEDLPGALPEPDANRGDLIIRGTHRRAPWYWHKPLSPVQVIKLYAHFKTKRGNPNN